MKKIFLFLILFSTTAFSQTKKLTAESAITRVTVFSSGAQLLRMATVSVLPGRSEIIFSGLSNQLEQQSIQLNADANITLLSVQAVKDFDSRRKLEGDERELADRRLDLQDKLATANRQLQVYKKEEDMIVKNEAIGGQAGVKSAELKLALDLHRARLTEVYQKQTELEKQIAAYQKEMAKASAHLSETGRKKDSVNYTVVALIDSKIAQSIKFQLLYTIQDAGWYPTYDLRVNDITKPLGVLMNANVFQRSGESWKDVSMELSTGNPGGNATPSILQPWMIGFYDGSVSWQRQQSALPGVLSGRVTDEGGNPIIGVTVIQRGSNGGTTTDANGFFKLQNLIANRPVFISSVGFMSKEIAAKPGYLNVRLQPSVQALEEVVVIGYGSESDKDHSYSTQRKRDIVGAVAAKAPGVELVAVNTQYQPTTTVYKIDEKYTIETDGKTTTISIKQFTMPAMYQYIISPKLDPAAFLTANILAWQEYDLQPGETNLYYEGTFLGKTYLDLTDVGDTLSLSLGKDNNIKVTRKLLKEFSTKKFIGSNRTETKEYEITILNTKKVAASIVIKDQFPVSTIKEISVEDVSAPEAQIDKESGIATWNISLPPGQEKKVKIRYSVKYPKDRRVIVE